MLRSEEELDPFQAWFNFLKGLYIKQQTCNNEEKEDRKNIRTRSAEENSRKNERGEEKSSVHLYCRGKQAGKQAVCLYIGT